MLRISMSTVSLLFFFALLLVSTVGRAETRTACDGFIFLADGSGSMDQKHKGLGQIEIMKSILNSINRHIPAEHYLAALRIFGHDFSYADPLQSKLLYPISPFDRDQMEQSIFGIENELSWSWSSLGYGLEMTGRDIEEMNGKIHIILFSDGDENSNYTMPMDVARSLKKKYGERICLYAVQIAPTTRGREILDALVAVIGCGRVVTSEELQRENEMSQFIGEVFGRGDFDSDGDGIFDRNDSCPGTPKGAPVDTEGCWHPEVLFFDYDKALIRPAYLAVLDRLAAIMRENPSLALNIEGHASSEGTEEYNFLLSQRRAAAVKKYLVLKDVAAKRMISSGLGEKQPVSDNLNEQGRAKNRRVLFIRK